MWRAKAKNGKVITSYFWDWCLMQTIIENTMFEKKVSYDEAYKDFWANVKEYNKKEWDKIFKGSITFDEALGDGLLTDIRIDYLEALNMEAEEFPDEEFKKETA